MSAYRGWRSLRELDVAAGLPRGSAFRAFKRAAACEEGRDYVILGSEAAQALRAEGRLYATSVRAILLAPAFAEALLRELAPRR